MAHLLDFPVYLELNLPLSFLGHVSNIFRGPFLLALCSHQNLQLLQSEGVRKAEYIRSGRIFLREGSGERKGILFTNQKKKESTKKSTKKLDDSPTSHTESSAPPGSDAEHIGTALGFNSSLEAQRRGGSRTCCNQRGSRNLTLQNGAWHHGSPQRSLNEPLRVVKY